MQNALDTLIKNTVEGLGYQLWGHEYRPYGESALLRIFIEKDDGISVEDCATVSRQLGAALDVENLIPVAYILEVSSPGMDRVLFTPDQYQPYLGNRVKIRTRTPIEERRNFNGLIKQVNEHEVTVEIDKQDFEIPFEMIDRARLVLD